MVFIFITFRFWILLEHPQEDKTQIIVNSVSEDPNKEIKQIFNKLLCIRSLIKFMIPVIIGVFFEFLITQGLVSVLLNNLNMM